MVTVRRLVDPPDLPSPASSGWPWLTQFRQQAWQAFTDQGLPDRRLEEWKYTNIKTLAATGFQYGAAPYAAPSVAQLCRHWLDDEGDDSVFRVQRLLFVAGRFEPQLSRLSALPGGALLLPLSQALEQQQPLIQSHLGQVARHGGHPFAALNSLWWEDGLVLYLPAGCRLQQPVHCLFYTPGGEDSRASFPRLLIVLEAGAQALVLEDYLGRAPQETAAQQEAQQPAAQLTNALSEVRLAAGASLKHCTLLRDSAQGQHIGGLHVEQAASSRFQSFSLALSGAMCRRDVQVRLQGEGAEALLNGLYLLAGRQHLDNHLRVDHLLPGCRSEVLYKGVLFDRAHGVFSGQAVVHPGAQRSDARQVNKNLLLSEGAEIDSKPELQIEADDVQCSHGAAVGQLDPQALFYLASRGLDPESAQTLLTLAFARETLDRLDQGPLRQRLLELTIKTLNSRIGAASARRTPS